MADLLDELDLIAAERVNDADDLAKLVALQGRAQRGGVDGMEATLELSRLIGEAGDPAATFSAALSIEMRDDRSAVCALVIACFAAVRIPHVARQDASVTRSRVSAAAAVAYGLVGASGPDVMSWLVSLVGITVRALSSDAASRVPVVRVETNLSLPASLIAWDLYADPQRGAELVDRNSSGTAMLMPAAFEALAS